MAANPCAEFFSREKPSVEDLPDREVSVQWELLTASPQHSPGPVKDDEELRRRILQPTHVDAEDAPTPACFNDLWSHGLSVDRASYRALAQSQADAVESVESWNNENPDAPVRSLRGLAVVSVGDLRSLRVNNGRALAIFDTAMESNKSHADVCAIGKMNKLERKDLRTSVWNFMRKGLGVI